MIAVKRVQQTPSLRVVFLTGAGPMFCAGGDPKAFQVRKVPGNAHLSLILHSVQVLTNAPLVHMFAKF